MKALPFLFSAILAVPAASGGPTAEVRQSAQLGVAANPGGLRLLWSGSLRRTFAWRTAEDPWSALEGGAVLAATPAYGQASLFAEWQPLPVLVLRAQGDALRFTGRYGGVLSFATASDPFGEPVLQRRRGEEEPGSARRTELKATLQYQTGGLLFRAPVTLVWVRFAGRGPWYYDPYWDTLFRDGDRIQEVQLQAGWNGTTRAGWLALGPAWQRTLTREAGLERRRAGLFLFLTRPAALGPLRRPYLALQAGRDLKDPNRTRQVYLEAGIGGRFGR